MDLKPFVAGKSLDICRKNLREDHLRGPHHQWNNTSKPFIDNGMQAPVQKRHEKCTYYVGHRPDFLLPLVCQLPEVLPCPKVQFFARLASCVLSVYFCLVVVAEVPTP